MSDPSCIPAENRKNFTLLIKCRCGQRGSATWEEKPHPGPQGRMPAPHGVSAGFYVRVRKNDISASEIACAACNAVVRARAPAV